MSSTDNNWQMAAQGKWLENDSRFIPAHWYPALLVDLLERKGVDPNKTLRSTGIFYEDIAQGSLLTSPDQFDCIIGNAKKHFAVKDLSFIFGHTIYPGNLSSLSNAIMHCSNLEDFFDLFDNFYYELCPYLKLKPVKIEGYVGLEFQDAFGASPHRKFLIEAFMTACKSVIRWLAGRSFPWRFEFDYEQPGYIEEYEVHLSHKLYFSKPKTMFLVEGPYLNESWPNSSSVIYSQAISEFLRSEKRLKSESFVRLVTECIEENIKTPLDLENTASTFGLSTSTFKRKLKKHGVNFQRLIDDVRRSRAIYLIQHEKLNNEQLANFFGFHDSANFRRSFKRWTGKVPGDYRNQ
ncbi:AraC family transcriptional regulator [Teredinibacter sp. KSP-S5-2]|uniref:AraC family transcriptional regulator n=1 Tax=Teredinibacter sp. KSP-S5-2 TaxID=3034506 RepID=UPI00293443BC|nr:AraC family transcriptional regulator ligand-binding domain-containing protein [Teredinibacter sp. KSP-S5-2]WNO09122.1 AraC family transcriptional regulator ligand-binding domain-containing protein [Teredinibacter sp. KSP-S5-2]